ncbi:MAG: hypothetical protein ABW007_19125 [Chitinophagaceae bacterium]
MKETSNKIPRQKLMKRLNVRNVARELYRLQVSGTHTRAGVVFELSQLVSLLESNWKIKYKEKDHYELRVKWLDSNMQKVYEMLLGMYYAEVQKRHRMSMFEKGRMPVWRAHMIAIFAMEVDTYNQLSGKAQYKEGSFAFDRKMTRLYTIMDRERIRITWFGI